MKRITVFLILLIISTKIIAQEYNRIISLAPSVTKNIYYLNSQTRLVGCTNYCTQATKDKKPVVASAVTINIEKIISLKPDLVIATIITPQKNIELLKKFNIPVKVFPTPKTFDEICLQFVETGKLLNQEQEATRLINKIKIQVDSIKNSCKNTTKNKVFFQIGAQPLFAVIPNTFMDDYIRFVNGINIITDVSKGTIARESVISRNPDFIFIATMGIIGNKEKNTWEQYDDLSAVKNNHIFIIDSDLACLQTPQTFLKTLKIIYNYMHLKKK